MTQTIVSQATLNTDTSRRGLLGPKRERRAATLGAALLVAGLAVVAVETSPATPKPATSTDAATPAIVDATSPFEATRDLTPVISEAINDHDAAKPFEAMRDLTPWLSPDAAVFGG